MNNRIDTLLAELTLEEKISLLAGADMWHTVPVPRLNIPVLKVTDGPNGARGLDGNTSPESACFPVGTALGATWNRDLVQQVGAALADETKAKGAHVLLAPTVNIHRTPIAGRNFECYSEDPYLTAQTAVAYITGLQSQGVAACIKHFVANDQEHERFSISSEVDERPLHELYLYPFQTAVAEATPWSLMSAYNRINGTYASENNRLLLNILKEEWGFDGAVISDWYGTYSPGVAAGGLDLEMPGPGRWHAPEIIERVHSGEIPLERIDDKVRRILLLMERTGALDQPALAPEGSADTPAQRQLARQAATEAIVLLKNEGSALPLNTDQIKSIAVIGENGRVAHIMGGGSSQVAPYYAISPLAGITNRAAQSGTAVHYALGSVVRRNPHLIPADWLRTADGRTGLQMTLYNNQTLSGDPAYDQPTTRFMLGWFGDAAPFVDPKAFSMRLQGTLTVPTAGSYTLHLDVIVGRSRLYLDGQLRLDNWEQTPNSEHATAVTLDLTPDQPVELLIEFATLPGGRWRSLRLGCTPPEPADPLAEAIALAQQCDAAIVVAGLGAEWEGEGFDRRDMRLPGDQDELIRQIAAVNPRTIVALNVGSPVEMPWLDEVTAVLQIWYGGQEMGNALADILFGDANPSGKLPTTFPKQLRDNPAAINYPGEFGQVRYGEGLFVGYRYYDAKAVEPLFPFGYGLSYTTFSYESIALNGRSFGPDQSIEVSVTIRNSGPRAGQEVVQLYVHDQHSTVVRPPKELKAYAKVALAAGETRTITFTLDRSALAYYNPAYGQWMTEAGTFELLVGSSAAHIHLTTQFEWLGEPEPELRQDGRFHVHCTARELLTHPRAKAILERHVPALLKAPEMNSALELTLIQIAPTVPDLLTPARLLAINNDLLAITD